jgi:predicted permease
MPEWSWFNAASRRARWVQVFARLKPGYTLHSARPSLQGLFRQIREYETTLPEAREWTAYSRSRFLEGTIHVESAATGYSDLRNSFSTALMVLMSMVGLVLLIACGNVANLLIARAFARQKEIAVRLSIGASRGQLVRQLLVESLVLSFAGGVAGVLLAAGMTRALLALVPSEGAPLLIQPLPDGRILLFTVAVTFVTGIVFGLAPALRASRPDVWTTLKDTIGSVAGSGSVYLRKGLVAAQVALSLVLLFGAGLFVRSLQNLKAAETGFRDPDNLVTFQLDPALNGYSEVRGRQFYRDLLERLRAVPGVRSAGIAAVPLLAGNEWDNSMQVEGHTAKDGENMQAFMNALSPGYFATMGVPMVEGRDFDQRDVDHAEKTKVAIVNRAFAKHFFGDRPAVGRHIGNGVGPKAKLDIEIIGVSDDTLYEGPREGVRRQVFIPHAGNGSSAIYIRAGLGSSAAYAAVRRVVKELDAGLPVYELKTLGRQLDETLLTERLTALLSAGFGALATLLAAIGLYGVMAFVVARRTREMGLRMALGAHSRTVVWLVMKEVLILLGIGLAVGVPSALALSRFAASQLYGIQATDPRIAAASVVLLAVVAAFAGFIPARRASRIDPILALRYE